LPLQTNRKDEEMYEVTPGQEPPCIDCKARYAQADNGMIAYTCAMEYPLLECDDLFEYVAAEAFTVDIKERLGE